MDTTTLRARRLARLREKLVSEAARAAWEQNLRVGIEEVLDTPVERLFPLDAARRAVEASLARPWLEGVVAPAVEASLLLVAARTRESTHPLGHYVPEAHELAVKKYLGRPGLVPERLLREVVLDDAVEEVMRDVLFDVLRQFYDRMNPFSSDTGPVAILRRMAPLGFGVMSKGIDAMRGELESRLEPEIRKFLQGITRKALTNLVETTIAKADEPKFVALRHHLLRWTLDQRVVDVVPDPTLAAQKDLRALARDLTLTVLTGEDAKREIWALVQMAIVAHGRQPLREALAVYGIAAVVDHGALAAVSWPFVTRLVESDGVWDWFERLSAEVDDELATEGA